LLPDYFLRDVIGRLLSPPLFPLNINHFNRTVDYRDFMAGEVLHNEKWAKAGIRVRTCLLSHPDRATGYRIEYQGKSMCYITDYEHSVGHIDENLSDFIRGSDCLIYDSTYADEHFERYKGWGHSTWQQGVRLANHAGVKTLIAFHNDPDASDDALDARAASLKAMRPDSYIARDGMELHLGNSEATHIVMPQLPVNDNALSLVKRLTAIGMALSGAKDLNRLLEIILEEAKDIARADGGTLYYLNEHNQLEFSIIRNNSLHIAYGGSNGEEAVLKPLDLYDPVTKTPNYATLAAYAVLTRSPVNIPDVYSSDGFDFEGAKAFDRQHNYRTRSVIAIPMVSHTGDVLGCLQLVNAKDASGKLIAFSQATQELVHSLASQAAVTLETQKLVQAQKKLLESFIQMIAQAIDAKSHYTGAHCERVPMLTNMLARAACAAQDGPFKNFNLTDEEKYELHIAGWIHDCGKVATPVHIMDKSTKLETISDRIELVKTRFEVLKRDAKIAMLEASLQANADRAALQSQLDAQLKQLESDCAFIEKINIGGEFMSDEDVARLNKIAAFALTKDEAYNLSTRRGTLTKEEREIMNDHMVHTCNMLDALPFPKHLKRVPEYAGGHHERMDGKGYPKGIKAGSMSIPARMMAIADVFEALTAADRPYKPAKKLSEAMQIIGHMKRDNHLDPELVDFFITSKTYLEYARTYLPDELIDAVDEQAVLAITPKPF
jgi:HD-GYP domain-containing protein (c-di-GMP phosphodiesterase class II)